MINGDQIKHSFVLRTTAGPWHGSITLHDPLLLTWFNFNPSMDK